MYRLHHRLVCLVLVALAVAPSPVAAQTAVTLTWDQPSPTNVTGYRVSLDGGWQDYGSSLIGADGSCVCSVALNLAAGTHTVIVAAYNASGEASSDPLVYTVEPTSSSHPGAPASPSPAGGSISASMSPTLTWSSTNATTYDVRFDTTSVPSTVVASALTTAAYQRMLTAGTKYYWQVVARNSAGETTGPVWSFTTPSAQVTGAVPAPWANQDIGDVGTTGKATFTNGTFTTEGGGLGIGYAADAFHYVSQPLTGDGEIVARVTALQNTNGHAKAGVMMRGSLTASGQHVILNAGVGGIIEFISRSSTGSSATFIAGAQQTLPAWLKLTRVGETVTGSVSNNGQTWAIVGSTRVAGLGRAGLVVTSADKAVANVSRFDAVTVSTGDGPAAPTGDLVIYASNVPRSARHGSWLRAWDPTSPNGIKLTTKDAGITNTTGALVAPTDYVDITFNAAAATPYTVWLRLRASNNKQASDSVWVQLSDAVVNGSPIYPIGSTSGLLVTLATDATGSSLNQWGWQNGTYGMSQSTTLVFATAGQHTLRLQVGEDGVEFDQLVMSPSTYRTRSPGEASGDLTVVPKP